MRLPALAVVLILSAGLVRFGVTDSERAGGGFPHALHEGLFPTCIACHGGIAENGAAYTVAAEDCASCHDGDLLDAVAWTEPAPGDGRLLFDHELHIEGAEIECATCHERPRASDRMDIERRRFEACQDCHGLESHYSADNDCAMCHESLADLETVTQTAVLSLPRPADHDEPGFLLGHGVSGDDVERCAVCHTRDLCERCHLNAGGLDAIQALAPDDRVGALVAGVPGTWPEPGSHEASDWIHAHGAEAGSSGEACATCHLQDGCRTCHGEVVPGAVAGLSRARPGLPAGAEMADLRPPLHGDRFALEHGAAAAADNPRCASCHEPTQCEACHAGAETPGFHPVNFVTRHGADAFGREQDCASCHSIETFCRDCHASSGLARVGVGTSAYHDAQPDWLLAHGRAARQGMESCASCHQQQDCLPCHSAKGGWSINPHGPGFEADRLASRSQFMCAQCHFDLPD
jgi:hypothetical protein